MVSVARSADGLAFGRIRAEPDGTRGAGPVDGGACAPFLWARSRQVKERDLGHQRLEELLQPLIAGLGYEFVGLEYGSHPKQSVLRIYIDSDDGVGLSDCEFVSREVAALLDVEDPISGQYNLEISSPGLDRPLFTPAQYRRFAGENAAVTVFAPVGGRRKFKGRIVAADEESVRMSVDGEEYELAFGNIAKGRLVPDYDAVMASMKK